MKNIESILFVCTGNSCRSPMAEALAKEMFANNIKVASAGTHVMPGMKASSGSIVAMQKIDLDLSKHESQMLTEDLIDQYDLLICMTIGHKRHTLDLHPDAIGKVSVLTDFLGGESLGIDDPVGLSSEAYEECAKQIQKCLQGFLKELLEERQES